MGGVMLIFTIISVCIEIIKLIVALRKKNPKLAKECLGAMESARKQGDLSGLQKLLDRLRERSKE